MRLSAVLVLQPTNAHSALETIRFLLEDLGLDLVLVQLRHDFQPPVTPHNFRQQRGPVYDETTLQTMIQTTNAVFDMARIDRRIHIEKGTREDWQRFLIDPQSGQKPCMCTTTVFVDAFGNLRGCAIGEILGNVRETDLADYLASKIYTDFKIFSDHCHICTHGCS